MNVLAHIKKKKEKLILEINDISEIRDIDFKSLLPQKYESVEIFYSSSKNILKIDFVTEMSVKKNRECVIDDRE